jgi:hypothetical protein
MDGGPTSFVSLSRGRGPKELVTKTASRLAGAPSSSTTGNLGEHLPATAERRNTASSGAKLLINLLRDRQARENVRAAIGEKNEAAEVDPCSRWPPSTTPPLFAPTEVHERPEGVLDDCSNGLATSLI